MVESASNLTNNPSSEADFPASPSLPCAPDFVRLNLICPVPEISSCQHWRPRRIERKPNPARAKQHSATMNAKIGDMAGTAPSRKARPSAAQPQHIAVHSPNSTLEGGTSTETAIDMETKRPEPLRIRGRQRQTLPNTSVPLVPPNPNEFLTAILIGIWRAALAQ